MRMKNKMGRSCVKVAAAMAFALAASAAMAVQPMPTNELVTITRPRTYVSEGLEWIQYRLYVPEGLAPDAKVPLVVYLHGSGACGSDNVLNLRDGPDYMIAYSRATRTPVIVVSPQCPQRYGWSPLFWTPESAVVTPEPLKMERLVRELIDQCVDTLPVDTNAVLLTGVSLGGFGAWSMLAHNPDLFAAVMPVCGGGDPKACARFRKVPIWIVHGERDGVVPVKLARAMVSELWRLDAPVRYREVPDAGHAVWGTYGDDSLLKWFFSRRKQPPPVPPAAGAKRPAR